MAVLSREEIRATLAILRSEGFSSVWQVQDEEQTEVILMMPGDELASVDLTAVTIAVMRAIPHTKVWLIPVEDTANLQRLL